MSRNSSYDKVIHDLKLQFNSETAIDILNQMHKTYEAKDNDYSSTGLPMGNLRKCEDAGIDAWRGCLVRMGDKISRLENFLHENEYQVISEKAEDTIIDLANYSILCYCLLEEEIQKIPHKNYIDLTKDAQNNLKKLTYYCVFQAMLWKDNDPENELSNLEKALAFWSKLCDYSLEMV